MDLLSNCHRATLLFCFYINLKNYLKSQYFAMTSAEEVNRSIINPIFCPTRNQKSCNNSSE